MPSAPPATERHGWLDQQLSLALGQPETHSQTWTTEMMKRTREFQQK
jgi:general secretion pathway protein A